MSALARLLVAHDFSEPAGAALEAATQVAKAFGAEVHLLHVLPRGFCRLRHYGLLANRHKADKLAACRRYFGTTTPKTASDENVSLNPNAVVLRRMGIDPDRCNACGSRKIRRQLLEPMTVPPRIRAPTRAPS